MHLAFDFLQPLYEQSGMWAEQEGARIAVRYHIFVGIMTPNETPLELRTLCGICPTAKSKLG